MPDETCNLSTYCIVLLKIDGFVEVRCIVRYVLSPHSDALLMDQARVLLLRCHIFRELAVHIFLSLATRVSYNILLFP